MPPLPAAAAPPAVPPLPGLGCFDPPQPARLRSDASKSGAATARGTRIAEPTTNPILEVRENMNILALSEVDARPNYPMVATRPHWRTQRNPNRLFSIRFS